MQGSAESAGVSKYVGLMPGCGVGEFEGKRDGAEDATVGVEVGSETGNSVGWPVGNSEDGTIGAGDGMGVEWVIGSAEGFDVCETKSIGLGCGAGKVVG